MDILSSISALWQLIKWIRSEKKQLEANADAYLTEERAAEWRLNAEKMFYALASGWNARKLPRIVRWFFSATTADNKVGEFGLHVLKSKKLSTNDRILEEPIKPHPAH
jgi:hypothetical protein